MEKTSINKLTLIEQQISELNKFYKSVKNFDTLMIKCISLFLIMYLFLFIQVLKITETI